jgi:uncharacterized protein YndB with AHSA1/START domain
MDRAQITIDAPAPAIYEAITDITNMGRWSPETYRTAWVGEPQRPVPGARFKGWNRAKVMGVPATWWTTSVIRRADPATAFSFDTPFSGARWTYLLDDNGDGTTTVTETREEIAHPILVKVLYGAVGKVRRQQLAEGMEVTLQRLKAELESSTAP